MSLVRRVWGAIADQSAVIAFVALLGVAVWGWSDVKGDVKEVRTEVQTNTRIVHESVCSGLTANECINRLLASLSDRDLRRALDRGITAPSVRREVRQELRRRARSGGGGGGNGGDGSSSSGSRPQPGGSSPPSPSPGTPPPSQSRPPARQPTTPRPSPAPSSPPPTTTATPPATQPSAPPPAAPTVPQAPIPTPQPPVNVPLPPLPGGGGVVICTPVGGVNCPPGTRQAQRTTNRGPGNSEDPIEPGSNPENYDVDPTTPGPVNPPVPQPGDDHSDKG